MDDRRRRFRPTSVLFSLLLLSPLAWVPGEGYDGIRLPIVLALTTLLLARRAWRAMRGGAVRGEPAPLLWSAGILAAWNLIALAAARSPADGAVPLLTLLAGVAVFAVVRGGSVAADFALEGTPVLVSILGLALASIGFVQKAYAQPAVVTEGNTNYSGALAGMLLPATLAFAFGRTEPARRLLAGVSAAALFALLLLTNSRGGWVGAVAGTLVAMVGLRLGRVPGTMATLAAAAILVGVPFLLRGASQVGEAGSGSVVFRLETWKSSLRMIAARPVLGVGPGNFMAEFPPYRGEAEFRASHAFLDPRAKEIKEVEDPHSLWVAAAAEAGAPGLMALLLVIYVAGRLWRHYVRTADGSERASVLAGLGGGGAAFLAAGFFNTLTLRVSHTILFWTFVALIELVGRGGERDRRPAGPWAVAVPLAASLAWLFATAFAWTAARAERELNGALGRDPAAKAALLERISQEHPAPWRALFHLERALADLRRPAEAVLAGRRLLRYRPHHLTGLNNVAISILRAGMDSSEAEQYLRHAADVAPYFYLSHYNLGTLRMGQKRTAEARAEFELALKANDRHASSELSLGETFALESNPAAALPHLRRAKELGLNPGVVLRQELPAVAADPSYAEFYR